MVQIKGETFVLQVRREITAHDLLTGQTIRERRFQVVLGGKSGPPPILKSEHDKNVLMLESGPAPEIQPEPLRDPNLKS